MRKYKFIEIINRQNNYNLLLGKYIPYSIYVRTITYEENMSCNIKLQLQSVRADKVSKVYILLQANVASVGKCHLYSNFRDVNYCPDG